MMVVRYVHLCQLYILIELLVINNSVTIPIKRRTELQSVMKEVRYECFPSISVDTIRRWINHYLKFGETPSETKRWFKKTRRNPIWTVRDKDCLMAIVEEDPALYLDEIRSRLIERQQKVFSCSSVYTTLCKLGFTLRVAYEKAAQRDEEERARWRTFIMGRGPDVSQQLIFVDETHKGKLDGRRRRHWVLRGREQPFYTDKYFGREPDHR